MTGLLHHCVRLPPPNLVTVLTNCLSAVNKNQRNDGKEKEGKERKRKERKKEEEERVKDMTGLNWVGQDRTGQDRTVCTVKFTNIDNVFCALITLFLIWTRDINLSPDSTRYSKMKKKVLKRKLYPCILSYHLISTSQSQFSYSMLVQNHLTN